MEAGSSSAEASQQAHSRRAEDAQRAPVKKKTSVYTCPPPCSRPPPPTQHRLKQSSICVMLSSPQPRHLPPRRKSLAASICSLPEIPNASGSRSFPPPALEGIVVAVFDFGLPDGGDHGPEALPLQALFVFAQAMEGEGRPRTGRAWSGRCGEKAEGPLRARREPVRRGFGRPRHSAA